MLNGSTKVYDEVIKYLYDQLPAYQRIGKKAFKKDLGNITKLCSLLGDPHTKFKSIHIAGTNGKGSVANMLSSIFQEAGYATGIYTSPHISDFRERIQLNGRLIHKNSVISFVKRMKQHVKEIRPSFFELTVAMAFDHFHRRKVDIAIVETGLGGRLDSTNILRPELSIITNIGLEHQAILGDSLELIAGEKAGIIKPGVPVVIGKSQRATIPVFREKAQENNAPITWADKQFRITGSSVGKKLRSLSLVQLSSGKNIELHLDLSGACQQENAVTVLAAVEQINVSGKFRISHAALERGMKRTTSNNVFKGRWQVIGSNPRIIADGSHNADGFRLIRQHLKEESFNKLHIIYGCVADKELDSILPLLPKRASYYLTEPDVIRRREVASLDPEFRTHELKVAMVSSSPKDCLDRAKTNAGKDDLILITGSIFLLSSFL